MTVEVKSVNHRFLDIAFRMQRNLGFLEEPIRKALSQTLARGHVDVFVQYRNLRQDAKEAAVDRALIQAYRTAFKEVAQSLGIKDDMGISEYATLPDVVTIVEKEDDREAVTALLLKTLDLAVQDLVLMRKNEGKALCNDLKNQLDALTASKDQIALAAPQVPKIYRARLEQRLLEAAIAQIDPQRIAQEVALFADKCAIDEELSRLDSHIAQMHLALKQSGETGRKLDFLVQEMNREVNTIGSKAADIGITAHVVSAKSQIEKLREQVQNVE